MWDRNRLSWCSLMMQWGTRKQRFMVATSSTISKTSGVSSVETADIANYAHLIRNSVMPLEIESRSRRFTAAFRAVSRGRFECLDVSASEHTVERTAELIGHGQGNGRYKLSLMLEGQSIVMQDGREAVLRTGDLAIYDTSRPYSLLASDGARTAILMFPCNLIALSEAAVGELTAVRFDRTAGIAASVSPFIAHLMGQMEQFEKPVGSRLSHNIVDILGTMLSAELDQRQPAGGAGAALGQIMEYIDAHLADPELKLNAIAAAHFVSPRYLQVLFQRNGLTVSSWIRERRLEQCRRDLEDPALRETSVAVIAERWGLIEPTHFSRSFKRHFGFSPREVRANAGL